GDVYVDDAFGAAHRAHASTVGMVTHFRDRAAGLLLAREVEVLSRILQSPEKPFVSILGGAKVSDKIGVIENLLGRVQPFVVGGAMAYPSRGARGRRGGRPGAEEERAGPGRKTLARAKKASGRVLLPLAHLAADRPEAGARTAVAPADDFPADMLGVDIGPAT